MKLEPIWKEFVSSSRPVDMYSFVCNAVLAVCKSNSYDRWCNMLISLWRMFYDVFIMKLYSIVALYSRLYKLTSLCYESASHVAGLCSEFMGIINSFCCSPTTGLGYENIVQTVNVCTFTIICQNNKSESVQWNLTIWENNYLSTNWHLL